MTWTRTHLCMDILGVLSLPDKKLKNCGFTNEDGKDATPNEIREYMKEQLKLGYDYFTMGDCDNRDKTGRCAGHPCPEEDGEQITTYTQSSDRTPAAENEVSK